MNGDNKNLVITILTIIGGLVVLGWGLRITISLLGPILIIGGAILIYVLFFKGRAR